MRKNEKKVGNMRKVMTRQQKTSMCNKVKKLAIQYLKYTKQTGYSVYFDYDVYANIVTISRWDEVRDEKEIEFQINVEDVYESI
jgi:hypothetical protein